MISSGPASYSKFRYVPEAFSIDIGTIERAADKAGPRVYVSSVQVVRSPRTVATGQAMTKRDKEDVLVAEKPKAKAKKASKSAAKKKAPAKKAATQAKKKTPAKKATGAK